MTVLSSTKWLVAGCVLSAGASLALVAKGIAAYSRRFITSSCLNSKCYQLRYHILLFDSEEGESNQRSK